MSHIIEAQPGEFVPLWTVPDLQAAETRFQEMTEENSSCFEIINSAVIRVSSYLYSVKLLATYPGHLTTQGWRETYLPFPDQTFTVLKYNTGNFPTIVEAPVEFWVTQPDDVSSEHSADYRLRIEGLPQEEYTGFYEEGSNDSALYVENQQRTLLMPYRPLERLATAKIALNPRA